MTTWIAREDGYMEGVGRMLLLFRDGELLGRMGVIEADKYVLTNGIPEDVYTEEYEGGQPPVTVNIQYLLDVEAKWQKFLAEQEVRGD